MAITTYVKTGSPTWGVAEQPTTFIVPQGVTSITVDLQGGAGGPNTEGVLGGKGGRLVVTMTVAPGQILKFFAAGTSIVGQPFSDAGAGYSGSTHFAGIGEGDGGSGGGFSSVTDAAGVYLAIAGGGGGAGGSAGGGIGGDGGLSAIAGGGVGQHSDDFNRSNTTSSVGGSWSSPFPVGFTGTAGQLGISGNQAYYPSGNQSGHTFDSGTTVDCGIANGLLTFYVAENSHNTSTQAGSGQYMGGIFRRASDGSYWRITYNALYFVNASGGVTTYNTGTAIWPNVLGSTVAKVSVILNGSSIKVFNASGTLIQSITSTSNQTATQHGWWLYVDGVFNADSIQIYPRIEDWSFVGSDMTAAAGGGPGTTTTEGAAGSGTWPGTSGGHSRGFFGYSYLSNDAYSGGDGGYGIFAGYGGAGGGAGWHPGGGGAGVSTGVGTDAGGGGGGGSSYYNSGLTLVSETSGYNTYPYGIVQVSFTTPAPYGDYPWGDIANFTAFSNGSTALTYQRFGLNGVYVQRASSYYEDRHQNVGTAELFYVFHLPGFVHYADTVTVDWKDGTTDSYDWSDNVPWSGPPAFPPTTGLADTYVQLTHAYTAAGMYRPEVTLTGPGGTVTYGYVYWMFVELVPLAEVPVTALTSGTRARVEVTNPITSGNVCELFVDSPSSGSHRIPDVNYFDDGESVLPYWQDGEGIPTLRLRDYGFGTHSAGAYVDLLSNDSDSCLVTIISGIHNGAGYVGYQYAWRTMGDGGYRPAGFGQPRVEVRFYRFPDVTIQGTLDHVIFE